jgi:hypothetical protein
MRAWLGLALLGVCLGVATPARAWLTTSVQADNVIIELSRDGTGIVSHELLLRVRGGPLKQFVIPGVDPDLVPTGDATIVRAKSGREAGIPIPLIAAGDSEGLRLAVTYEKGLPGGSYLVRFSYKTDLQGRDRISRNGDWAVVTWTGPQFADGLDLLQTTFVVPRADRAPRLLGADEADPTAMVAREEGVFLSEVHRGADLDRLTLSRPHAAKGERVQWQAEVDASLFNGLAAQVVPARSAAAAPTVVEPTQAPEAPWRRWVLTLAAALLLPLLTYAKHRGARTVFVVPLGIASPARYLASFLAMGSSVLLALELGQTTWAGVLLLASMLLSLQRPSVEAPVARGPGRWQDVQLEALEFPAPTRLGRVAWLDGGSYKGLLLFVIASVGFMVVGLRLLGASPYHSAMTLVYSAVLVPLFFTLGALSGKGPVEAQRDFLSRLGARMRKWRGVEVRARGRFPLGAAEPDELRVALTLSGARSGLIAVEVGVGFTQASLKRIALPVVIVRVRDGSPAHRALPRDAEWSRGRDAEERVALIRPPLPLLPSIAETTREVCQALRDKPRRAAHAQVRVEGGQGALAKAARVKAASTAAREPVAEANAPRRAFQAPKPAA